MVSSTTLGTCFILFTLAILAQAQDPCSLPYNNNPSGTSTAWFGRLADVKDCFDNVPLSSSALIQTSNMVKAQLELYSFADIARSPIAPYQLEVDWPAELNTINTTVHNSDYDMHSAFNQLYASFLDAHLAYIPPIGYTRFSLRRPFRITSQLDTSGNQVFVLATAGYMTVATYNNLCANNGLTCTDPTSLIGQQVTHVNGIAIAAFIPQQMGKVGWYIDSGVQFNQFSNGVGFSVEPLAYMPLATSDTYTITFSSGSTVTFHNWYFYSNTNTIYNNEAAFSTTGELVALNIRDPAKRDETSGHGVNLLDESLEKSDIQLLQRFDSFFTKNSEPSLRREVKNNADVERLNSALHAIERVRSRVMSRNTLHPQHRYTNAAPIHVRHMEQWRDWEALNAVMLFWNHDDIVVSSSSVSSQKSTASSSSSFSAASKARLTKRSSSDVVTSSMELPLVTGDPSLFSLHAIAETGAIQHLSYNGTTLIRLSSFSPDSGTFSPMQTILRDAVNNRGSLGLNNNLIIDVSGNGGGYICLAQTFMAFLAAPWENHQYAGSDVLFMPYDLRKSSYQDDLFNRGFLNPSTDERSPETGAALGNAFYTNGVTKDFEGGITGQYTQKFVWTDCGASNWMDATQWFDKILVISDGLCGSACSLFTSGLRQGNKIRLMSYGGLWGTDMDTSSFAGGNVENWDNVVDALSPANRPSWLQLPDSTSTSSFNHRQMFLKNGTIPRQYVRIPADYVLPYWEPMTVSRTSNVISATEQQYLANLYSSALYALEDMPSGLTSVDGGSPNTNSPSLSPNADSPTAPVPTSSAPPADEPTGQSAPSVRSPSSFSVAFLVTLAIALISLSVMN